MRLLVFGLGYSASHFVATRRAAFGSVVGTTRDPAAHAGAPGVALLRFDGARADAGLDAEVAACDALLVSVPPDGAGADPVLARFGDAIAAARNLRAIVYLSSISVYGDRGGALVDEASPLAPTAGRALARVAVEAAWGAFALAAGRRVHALRLAGIYGPGRNQIVNLREGTAKRVVKPGQVFNRIHVEDIARAIEAALAAGGPPGLAAWNVADDEPAPPQDVVAYAAGLVGVPPPPEVAFDAATMSPMARAFYGDNKRVSNRRMREDLGVALAYPTYREGLRSLLPDGW